ncbi:MAG: hypothetical protein AAF975_01180 [Spirochaetota bacterium]
MSRFVLILLFFSTILSSCIKSIYFVADPYWETVTEVSFSKIRFMGLKSGYWVRVITAPENIPWYETEVTDSLKIQIEDLLRAKNKVLLSPYWLRDLEEQPLEFSQGQLVLIDAVSTNPQIQSVIIDMEKAYYEVGQIAGTFMQQNPQRQQAIAIFYRGTSYDKYYQSFEEGFRSNSPAKNSLATQRYYAAEINDISTSLERIDPSQNLVILAMGHLSDQVYRELSGKGKGLFVVENFGSGSDSQILLSLDSDYSLLIQKAILLKPMQTTNPEPISKVPHALHLPNPELVRDIELVRDLAETTMAKQEKQKNRLSLKISRAWDQVLDFIAHTTFTDIPWPEFNLFQ